MSLDSAKEYLAGLVEGKIDFEGQKKVDRIIRVALIAATIVSFLFGFVFQSLQVTLSIFGFSTVLLCLVVVPPWSMYNLHPVRFLPAKPKKEPESNSQ